MGAVWNLSYRICWIMLTFIGSLGSAMGILLGNSLGAGNAQESRRIALVGTTLALVLVTGLSLVVVICPRILGSIFTTDDEVLDLFEFSRWPMAAFVLTMNMGTMMETIPASAGRMNTTFVMGIIGSWVGQVPAVFLCTLYWRNDLVGLYTGVSLGYLLLVLLLGVIILRMDWEEVAREAQARSKAFVWTAQGSRNFAEYGLPVAPAEGAAVTSAHYKTFRSLGLEPARLLESGELSTWSPRKSVDKGASLQPLAADTTKEDGAAEGKPVDTST